MNRSLKTKVKRFAEVRLSQYVRGQFNLGPKITVKEYYEQWIETKKTPFVRKSTLRDYRQHFETYVLPVFGTEQLVQVSAARLLSFRSKLLASGLKLKTCQNILGGSFRALWRAAMVEEIVDKNPFASLKWPTPDRWPPDPFTIEEQDKILAHVQGQQPFYYPFVYIMFMTGMRPSEAVALRISDVDPARRTLSITTSRHLGAAANPKTARSRRLITVAHEVIELIEAIRLPWQTPDSHVFYNKFSGGPLDANQWARVYWADLLKGSDVRHRKFYSTRHTFITDMVSRRENIKAIADYCGTSIEMIERNYCGTLSLSHLTEIKPEEPKSLGNMVVPTGIEPAGESKHNIPELINSRLFEYLRRRKVG